MNNSIIKSNGALTALLTFTLFSIVSAQTPAAGAQSDIATRVDQLFARFDRPDSPGCALGIIKDGKLIYKKGYGMANLEHDIPSRSVQTGGRRRWPIRQSHIRPDVRAGT
jgi:CubicO group peptidase (beta-lactamase class C family)